MEDRDAEGAVGVDVGVVDGVEEAELGRGVGVVIWEDHFRLVKQRVREDVEAGEGWEGDVP